MPSDQRRLGTRAEDPFLLRQGDFGEAQGLPGPARLRIGVDQVGGGRQRVRVVPAEHPGPGNQHPLTDLGSLVVPAGPPVGDSEVGPAGERQRVVGTEDALQFGDGPLLDGESLLRAPDGRVGGGELHAGPQRVPVVGAEHPFSVGQDLLLDGNGLRRPSGFRVDVREVGADGHRIRVVAVRGRGRGRPARAEEARSVGVVGGPELGGGAFLQRERLRRPPHRAVRDREAGTRADGVGVERAEGPFPAREHLFLERESVAEQARLAVGGAEGGEDGQGDRVLVSAELLVRARDQLQQPGGVHRSPGLPVGGGQVRPGGEGASVERAARAGDDANLLLPVLDGEFAEPGVEEADPGLLTQQVAGEVVHLVAEELVQHGRVGAQARDETVVGVLVRGPQFAEGPDHREFRPLGLGVGVAGGPGGQRVDGDLPVGRAVGRSRTGMGEGHAGRKVGDQVVDVQDGQHGPGLLLAHRRRGGRRVRGRLAAQ